MRVYQTAFDEQDLLYYKQKDNNNKIFFKTISFVVHAIFNRCVTLAATCFMLSLIVVSRLLLRVT